MGSVLRRLVVTLVAVAAFLCAAEMIPLPDVHVDAARLGFGNRYGVGAFALGITPVLGAYVVVETIAFLVPAWNRWRHENPAGRAKLDRAVALVALALSLLQGYAAALRLEALPSSFVRVVEHPGVPFRLTTTLTLAGGVAASVALARFVSARGLGNGLVVLTAASALRLGFERDATSPLTQTGLLSPQAWMIAAAALALAVYATLRCLAAANAQAASVHGAGNPYRAARSLLVRPVVPVPTGSYQAYLAATAALDLFVWAGLARLLPSNVGVAIALVVGLAFGLNVLFGQAMHRPSEIDALAHKLRADVGEKARAAVRRTYLPSLLFFVVIAAANRAFLFALGRSGLFVVPFLVAAVVDLVRRPGEGWVVVWEDRRVTAVNAIRAVLESHGLEVRVDGMAVLSLFQAFVPFAPARIAVPEASRARAAELLAPLLPESEERVGEGGAGSDLRQPKRKGTAPIAIPLAAAALGALVLAGYSLTLGDAPSRRTSLAIVRVDDTTPCFRSVIRTPHGIGIRQETLPIGDHEIDVDMAVMRFPNGKEDAAETASFASWLAKLPTPAGTRLAIGDWLDDSETIGLRSYLLRGEPIVRTEDIRKAIPFLKDDDDIGVGVELTEAAAKRFSDATAEWTGRRLALVIDDRIAFAPVVRQRISNGYLTISMGHGEDQDRLRQRARELAKALAPRR